MTAQRLAVLASLGQKTFHKTAESVATLARKRLGTLSTQAVYDNLAALVEAGLVRRIEPPGSAALYELRVGDNHHHLICRACGETHDVDCVTGVAPCLQPSAAHRFLIDEAEVIFWGLCPACQKKPARQRSRIPAEKKRTEGKSK